MKTCLLPGPLRPRRFIHTTTLIADTIKLCAQLPIELDAIIGIARSGILPAATIATFRQLPLYTVGRNSGPFHAGHGNRMPDQKDAPKYAALIDDTQAFGGSMIQAHARCKELWPNTHFFRAVIYTAPHVRHLIERWHQVEPGSMILEWNFANAAHTEPYYWDLDGIICHDYTGPDNDGPEYLNFLSTAQPLYLPRRHPVRGIITARCETYRPQTTAWLQRHGVNYHALHMGPWQSANQRRHANQTAEWKAQLFKDSPATIFVESDQHLAEAIARLSGKPTLCPTLGRLFP